MMASGGYPVSYESGKEISGLEPAVASGLKLIREQGAEAAYASCL